MKKNNYIFHLEWMELFRQSEMTADEIASIMTGIADYIAGAEPEFKDRAVRAVWLTIRRQLDYDIAAYEERCETNRANGKLGGRPKKNETEQNQTVNLETENNQTVFLKTEQNPTKPKKPDNDYDYEYDTDISTLSLTSVEDIYNNIYITKLENVYSYFDTKGSTRAEAEKFYEYYSQRDWKINGKPVISWQKVADRWISNIRSPDKKTKAHNFTQRNYSKADNDRLNRILFGH